MSTSTMTAAPPALRDGNDAVNHHREVLKLDPKYIDAQITIGLYEYVVG